MFFKRHSETERHRNRPGTKEDNIVGTRTMGTRVFGIPKFERFFRAAASLDVDKKDLKRHEEFVNRKVLDLLVAAEATAKANGRRVVEPFDLPITKGLQENIDRFLQLDSEVEVTAMLGSEHSRSSTCSSSVFRYASWCGEMPSVL